LEGPLRKSRYTEEQIILALKEHEAGRTTAQICRKLGVSEQTFCQATRKLTPETTRIVTPLVDVKPMGCPERRP
jgi:lambda repressor-like predicted transcriptional regulator